MTAITLRSACAIIGVSAVFSCKPPAGSDLDAITGIEDGQEKAFGLVSMRNSFAITESLNVAREPELGGMLKQLNESLFGLVECTQSVVKDRKVTAEDWLNFVEQMSFLGILYITPERQLEFLIDSGNGPQSHTPNCRLVPTRLLNLPTLVASSREIMSFPPREPSGTEAKLWREKYELMQTIFLAVRGPYANGAVGISPKVIGIQEAAGAYDSIDYSESAIVRGFSGGDAMFNPCVAAESSQGSLGYLQQWKTSVYACTPAGIPGLKNYRAGGAAGARYAEMRDRAAASMASLYRAAYGAPTSNSSKDRLILEVLTAGEPWSRIKGPTTSLARYLGGTGQNRGAGFGLDDVPSFDFRAFARGEIGGDLEDSDATGLSLAGSARGLARPSGGTAFQHSQYEGQVGGLMARLADRAITKPQDLVPYLSADWGGQLRKQAQGIDGGLFYAQRADKLTNATFEQLQVAARASDAAQDRLFAAWQKAEPALNPESAAGKEYYASRAKILDEFAGNVRTYEGNVKNANMLSVYGKAKINSGVATSQNVIGDALVKGEGIDGGALRDYRIIAKGKGGTAWVDQTPGANVVDNPNDSTTAMRLLGWDAKGQGFQKVMTAGVADTQGQSGSGSPGLDFNYSFKPNKAGSSVGQYFMNETQLASANKQLTGLVSDVQQTALANNVTVAGVDSATVRSGMANGEASAYTANTSNFWNGLAAMGGASQTAAITTNVSDQISTQQRFDAGGIAPVLTGASTQVAAIQKDATAQFNAGTSQAWGATTAYGNDAWNRGGSSYWGAAGTVASDAWGSASSYFGSGSSSTPPPQATVATPSEVVPAALPTTSSATQVPSAN